MKPLTILLALLALSTLPAVAQTKWYGETRFAANDTNWNDTSRFGWIYFPDGEGADPTFAWTFFHGWIYTSEAYYPYVYVFEQESWLFFIDHPKADFYNYKTYAYNFRNGHWTINGVFRSYAPDYLHPDEYWPLLGESFKDLTPVYYYGPNYEAFTFRTNPVVDGRTMNFRLVLQLRYQRYTFSGYHTKRVRIFATPIVIQLSEEDESVSVYHFESSDSDSFPVGKFSFIFDRIYTTYGEYTQTIYLQTGSGEYTPNIYFESVDIYQYLLQVAKDRLAQYYNDPRDSSGHFGKILRGIDQKVLAMNEPWNSNPDSPRSRMVEAMLFALASDRINGTTNARERVEAKFNIQRDGPVQPNHLLPLKK